MVNMASKCVALCFSLHEKRGTLITFPMNYTIVLCIVLALKAVHSTPCVHDSETSTTLVTADPSATPSEVPPTSTSAATARVTEAPSSTPSASPSETSSAVKLQTCGGNKFNPKDKKCCWGALATVYDPKKAICCINNGYVLPMYSGQVHEGNVTALKCCGEKSFYPNNQTCCHGMEPEDIHRVHPGKNRTCCYQYTYDPKNQTCCAAHGAHDFPDVLNGINVSCAGW